jgi:hypothetical protein
MTISATSGSNSLSQLYALQAMNGQGGSSAAMLEDPDTTDVSAPSNNLTGSA